MKRLARRDGSLEKQNRKEPFLYLLPVLLFLPIGVSLFFPSHAGSRSAAVLVPVPLFASSEADYSVDPQSYWIPPINLQIIRDLIQDQNPYAGDLDSRMGTLAAVLQTPVATMTRSPNSSGTSQPSAGSPETPVVAIPVTGPTVAPPTGFVPTLTITQPASNPVSPPTSVKTKPVLTPISTRRFHATITPSLPGIDSPTRTLTPTTTASPTKTFTGTATSPDSSTYTPTPSATLTPTATASATLTLTATFTRTSTPTPTSTGSAHPTQLPSSTPTPSDTPTLIPAASATASATPNTRRMPTATLTFTPSITPGPSLECSPPDLSNGFVLGVDPPDGARDVSFTHSYVVIYFNGEMKTDLSSGMVENPEHYQVINASNHKNLPILNRAYDPALHSLLITFDTNSPFWNAYWKYKTQYQVIIKGTVQNQCSIPQSEDILTSFWLESRQASNHKNP